MNAIQAPMTHQRRLTAKLASDFTELSSYPDDATMPSKHDRYTARVGLRRSRCDSPPFGCISGASRGSFVRDLQHRRTEPVLQTEPTAQVQQLAKAPRMPSPRVSLPIPSVEGDHKRTRDGIVLVHSIMARRRLRRLGRIRGRLLP